MSESQERLEQTALQIRRELSSGKLAEFETHGFSMIPLLHDGGDRVVLCENEGDLSVGDVAFCKTDDGRFVLHRVVGLRDGGYVLRGDNCVSTEFCPSNDDVIGRACAFIRRGRRIKTGSLRYKFYCRFRKQLLYVWQRFWKYADKIVQHTNK